MPRCSMVSTLLTPMPYTERQTDTGIEQFSDYASIKLGSTVKCWKVRMPYQFPITKWTTWNLGKNSSSLGKNPSLWMTWELYDPCVDLTFGVREQESFIEKFHREILWCWSTEFYIIWFGYLQQKTHDKNISISFVRCSLKPEKCW